MSNQKLCYVCAAIAAVEVNGRGACADPKHIAMIQRMVANARQMRGTETGE